MPGVTTLATEHAAHPSMHGVWLLLKGREYFLPYEQFPWFRDCDEAAVMEFEEVCPGHFYWPQLDVDLTLEMIEHPDRFPLVAH